jgi:hypothetical protein
VAKKIKKIEFIGGAGLLMFLGVFFLVMGFLNSASTHSDGIFHLKIGFVFFVLFVILFPLGIYFSGYWICENCGKSLRGKRIETCPTCKEILEL